MPIVQHFRRSNRMGFKIAILSCLLWAVIIFLDFVLTPDDNYIELTSKERLQTKYMIWVTLGYSAQQLFVLMKFTKKFYVINQLDRPNLVFQNFSFVETYGIFICVLTAPILFGISMLLSLISNTTPVVMNNGDYSHFFESPVHLIALAAVVPAPLLISSVQRMMETPNAKPNTLFKLTVAETMPGLYKFVVQPLIPFVTHGNSYFSGQVSGAIVATSMTAMFLMTKQKIYEGATRTKNKIKQTKTDGKPKLYNTIHYHNNNNNNNNTVNPLHNEIETKIQTRIIEKNLDQLIPTDSHLTAPRLYLNGAIFSWYLNFALLDLGFYSYFLPSLLILGDNIKTTLLGKNTTNNELFYIGEITSMGCMMVLNVMYAMEQYHQLLSHVISSKNEISTRRTERKEMTERTKGTESTNGITYTKKLFSNIATNTLTKTTPLRVDKLIPHSEGDGNHSWDFEMILKQCSDEYDAQLIGK